MIVKIGRNHFDITEDDVVLFNGAIWQLISQKIAKGWYHYSPVVAKNKANKWEKTGAIYLVKETGLYKSESGEKMGLRYYKFNIEKLKEVEQ